GIQSRDARHQQAADRPDRSRDSLRDRVPPVPWRRTDGHAADGASLLHSAGRTRRGARSTGPGRPRDERDTMKIFVVLAVFAVLAFLRFRRANLITWALAW